eukprot:jgi/Phyca11/130110/e_gw1.91.143.1
MTLKHRDGSPLSYSALNTHRAALFNLYRDFGFTMAKTLESELQRLKNKLAKDVGNGIGAMLHQRICFCTVKVSKVPLMCTHCQSIEDAINVYLACVDSVAVESTTGQSRIRRRGQLSWSTIGKLLRQAKKRRSET